MASNLGLLAARAIVGGGLFAHGAQKGLGWFEGPGPEGAAKFMSSLGFDPPDFYARAAYLNEMVGGGLVALGALGPVGPALTISNMIVAIGTVHAKNGFFAEKNGWERAALYAAGALALGSTSYGAISFDRITGLESSFEKPGRRLLTFIVAIAGALVVLAQRDVVDDGPASSQAQPQSQNGQQTQGSGTDVGAGV